MAPPTTEGSNKLRIIATRNRAETRTTKTRTPVLPAREPRGKTLTRLTPPENGSLGGLSAPSGPPSKQRHADPLDGEEDRTRAADHLRHQRTALCNQIANTPSYYHADGELQTAWMYRVAAMDVDDEGELLGGRNVEFPARVPRVGVDWLTAEQMASVREGWGVSGLRDEVKVVGVEVGRRRVGATWVGSEGGK